jgi:GTP-binding protein YchF
MALKAGIVGLPNVGKSTLFNAITNSNVEAANYPFATINPNSGVVEVNDPRVDELVSIFNPKRIIKATCEFTDIAGLVKGASKGEGLGNQFLGNIRNCDAICHVVRCFENPDIIHVENSIDPKRDIDIINLELIFSDLDLINKRIAKVETKARTSKDKESVLEYNLLTKIKTCLENEKSARSLEYTEDEKKLISNYNLLTAKPIVYVANVAEEDYVNPENSVYYRAVEEIAKSENAQVIPICANTECELSSLPMEDKMEYLNSLGVSATGLDRLVKTTYKLLNLSTFFTVGEDEVRAWTFTNGMTAPECAGTIHTDFQRGFICAEVYSYDDMAEFKSEKALKEAGKIRTEGKTYKVQDGDCMLIRFNV